MKQRLLLLTYMLASALFAGAYTVTFDVKFGSFMTDHNQLFIQLYGGHEEYYPQYDEATGKYVAYDVEAGIYSLRASYPEMLEYKSLEGEGWEVSTDMAIPLDFTGYHKATFKAPEGFEMSDAKVFYNKYNGIGLNSYLYLPDGIHQWKANFIRIADQMAFGVGKQDFTMNGSDREVVYAINANDYYKVTFEAKGVDGQPLPIKRVDVVANNGIIDFSLHSENLNCMLQAESYSCIVFPESNKYQKYQGLFNVEETDVKVKVPYNEYKKLSIEVLDNDMISGVRLNMTSMTNFDGGSSYSLIRNGDKYSGEYYLKPGVYDYDVSVSGSQYIMPETGQIAITEDKALQIDFTRPYYPVNFSVVNGQGTQLDVSDWELSVIDENGNSNNECRIDKPLWMHDGNYRAVCLMRDGDGEDIMLYQNLIVASQGQTVTFVYDELSYHSLEIVSKAPASGDVAFYLFADAGITFYKNGLYCGYAEINEADGSALATLPVGTYTYVVTSDYGMQPLKGGVTVTGNNDQLELDFSRYGVVHAKAENSEGKEIPFIVSQGNKTITTGWSESGSDGGAAILLLPEGTYNILAADGYENGSQSERTVTVAAGTSVYENFTWSARQLGKYAVTFQVYDGTNDDNEMQYTVTLDGYGEQNVLEGIAIFNNVTRTSCLTYTVTSPGYVPFTDVVEVSENNSTYGFVDVYVRMKMSPTAMDRVMADSKIAIYPTAPEDYLYIRPESESTGAWMVQLVSTTGAVVYSNKMQLHGETPVYVGNLPEGFYLLTLNNGEQRLTFKVIKK